jgi:hypothetical protein
VGGLDPDSFPAGRPHPSVLRASTREGQGVRFAALDDSELKIAPERR